MDRLLTECATPAERYLRIAQHVEDIRASGGYPQKVTICAATKTVDAAVINSVVQAGLRRAGENRVDEFTAKAPLLDPALTMDFIGTVQTNKLGRIVGRAALIQSVGSLHAVQEIQRLCVKNNLTQEILVEINSGREAAKSGVLPEDAAAFFDQIAPYDRVLPRGIMTVGPICEKKGDIAVFFEKTYEIFIDIFTKKIHNISDPILSMGMSENYDVAIACGATMIRPGRAIFGRRVYPV